jgi:hypothetical protein
VAALKTSTIAFLLMKPILFIPLAKALTISRASDATAIDDRRADGGGSGVRAPEGHYVEEKVHDDGGEMQRSGRLSAMAALAYQP